MKRALTDEQGRPATSRSQRTLVIAAPGSGKTFMAVERFGVLRYNHHQHDHRGIAAVSFARSASDELLVRIRRRWGGDAVRPPLYVPIEADAIDDGKDGDDRDQCKGDVKVFDRRH